MWRGVVLALLLAACGLGDSVLGNGPPATRSFCPSSMFYELHDDRGFSERLVRLDTNTFVLRLKGTGSIGGSGVLAGTFESAQGADTVLSAGRLLDSSLGGAWAESAEEYDLRTGQWLEQLGPERLRHVKKAYGFDSEWSVSQYGIVGSLRIQWNAC